MFRFFKRKSLRDHLLETKKVRIKGFDFEIKKLSPMDYLAGRNVLIADFEVPKPGMPGNKDLKNQLKQIEKHYTDVFLAAVIKPKISKKGEGTDIPVGEILMDWDLAVGLYEEILAFTYGGKKKLQLLKSQEKL